MESKKDISSEVQNTQRKEREIMSKDEEANTASEQAKQDIEDKIAAKSKEFDVIAKQKTVALHSLSGVDQDDLRQSFKDVQEISYRLKLQEEEEERQKGTGESASPRAR